MPQPGRLLGASVSKITRQAGCVAFYRGQVVLRRTATGDWVFPKGHLEPGETEEAAALRELAEESGLEAGILRPVGEVSYRHAGEDRCVLYFLAHVRLEMPSWADHEGRDAFLLAPDRVRTTLSFENNRQLWDLAYAAEKEARQ